MLRALRHCESACQGTPRSTYSPWRLPTGAPDVCAETPGTRADRFGGVPGVPAERADNDAGTPGVCANPADVPTELADNDARGAPRPEMFTEINLPSDAGVPLCAPADAAGMRRVVITAAPSVM